MPSVNEASQAVNTAPARTDAERPRTDSLFPSGYRVCCENCGVAEFDQPGLQTCNCIDCPNCGQMVDNLGNPPCVICGNCHSCCECWTCEGCDERFRGGEGERCGCCECCRGCCECVSCSRCGRRFRYGDERYCRECDYCTDHCVCNLDPDSPASAEIHFLPMPKKPCFHTGSYKSILKGEGPRRFVSCELEIARASEYVVPSPVREVAKRWKAGVVHDGSLGSLGFEICTAPASGDKFVEQLRQFCEALADVRYKVSRACGYHVHIDCRDLGWWGIRRLAMLYCKIEDALFSCLPRSRRSSHYCIPCSDKLEKYISGKPPAKIKKATFEMVYGCNINGASYPEGYTIIGKKGRNVRVEAEDGIMRDSISRVRTQKYHGARYAAMNLHSWFYRGTVENRMAAGTGNLEKIWHWAMLWDAIVGYAAEGTEKGITALASGFATLLDIAPGATKDWLRSRARKFKKNGDAEEFETDEA
jgi:hypothetical protein